MTKASNRKRKYTQRGRPRMDGVEREDNGRARRSTKPREDACATVIAYRMKHHALSEAEAKLDDAETVVGRLYMREAGKKEPLFTWAMREAAREIHKRHVAYMRAIDADFKLPEWPLPTRDDHVHKGFAESPRRERKPNPTEWEASRNHIPPDALLDYTEWAIGETVKWKVVKDPIERIGLLPVVERAVIRNVDIEAAQEAMLARALRMAVDVLGLVARKEAV